CRGDLANLVAKAWHERLHPRACGTRCIPAPVLLLEVIGQLLFARSPGREELRLKSFFGIARALEEPVPGVRKSVGRREQTLVQDLNSEGPGELVAAWAARNGCLDCGPKRGERIGQGAFFGQEVEMDLAQLPERK